MHGWLGYAKWALICTTTYLEVAIKYSRVADGKSKAMVLVIRTDRVGSCAFLQQNLQYQNKCWYLWLLFLFLQPE